MDQDNGASPPCEDRATAAEPKVSALRDGIPSAWRTLRRLDLPYWFRSRFIPSRRYHVVNTGLPPGWHDVDERMLYACMALLCSYVENEQGGEDGFPGVASGDSATDAEALTIYRWWKYQRAADHTRYDKVLMAWHGANPRTDEAFRAVNEADDENESRDQEMLHRLIDIRRTLWS